MEDVILYPGVEENFCEEIKQIKSKRTRSSGRNKTNKNKQTEIDTTKLDANLDIKEEFYHTIKRMKYGETRSRGRRIETDDIDTPVIISEILYIARSKTSPCAEEPLPSLCRLCATPCDDAIHIFGPTPLRDNIIEKIQRYLPITVKKTDTLSKEVCPPCLEKLESFNQFYNTVAEAEKQLIVLQEKTSIRLLKEMEIQCQASLQWGTESVVTENVDDQEPSNTVCDTNTTNIESQVICNLDKDSETKSSHCDLPNPEPSEERLNAGQTSPPQNEQGVCQAAPDTPMCETRLDEKSKSDKDMSGSKNRSSPKTKKRKVNAKAPLPAEKSSHSQRKKKPLKNKKDVDRDPVCEKEIESRPPVHQVNSFNDQEMKCDYCNQRFDEKSNLELHILIHNGTGPYSCDFCSKRFKFKPSRDAHRKSHQSEQPPFPCNVCTKTFNRKVNRDQHCSSIHTAKHPHKCDFCERVFKYKHNRDQHSSSIHMTNHPHKCDLCERVFKYKHNRDAHAKAHANKRSNNDTKVKNPDKQIDPTTTTICLDIS